MSIAGNSLFLFCAVLALTSAFGTILVKSPLRAAMSLLVHIVALSGLFLTLHAHLLAALQVLVYAGAVVVLFVFVVMLIGPVAKEQPTTRGLLVKSVSASLMGMFSVAIAGTVAGVSMARPLIASCSPTQGAECQQFGGVQGLAHALFVDGIVPFELIGILLTVAVVGAIAVARGKTEQEVAAAARRKAEQHAADEVAVAVNGGH